VNAKRPDNGISFLCPGCGHTHAVRTDKTGTPTWHWNGSLEAPTLSPSLRVRSGHHAEGKPASECDLCAEDARYGDGPMCSVCHSFVRDGRIEFLSDCTHALAGQTVDLPEVEQ